MGVFTREERLLLTTQPGAFRLVETLVLARPAGTSQGPGWGAGWECSKECVGG